MVVSKSYWNWPAYNLCPTHLSIWVGKPSQSSWVNPFKHKVKPASSLIESLVWKGWMWIHCAYQVFLANILIILHDRINVSPLNANWNAYKMCYFHLKVTFFPVRLQKKWMQWMSRMCLLTLNFSNCLSFTCMLWSPLNFESLTDIMKRLNIKQWTRKGALFDLYFDQTQLQKSIFFY